MGTSVNGAMCNNCGEEITVVLEWKGKKAAIEEIKLTKCPKCGSEDWVFTDSMGQ